MPIEYRHENHEYGGGGKYDIVDKGILYDSDTVKYNQVQSKGYTPTTSFSGSDMYVQFVFPGAKPVTVGTASTVAYSIFRDTRQVRTIGRISPKGITRGGRTVAGSLVFTVVDQHVTHDILNALKESNTTYSMYDRIKTDELPSFDVIVTFANEYGQTAHMVIYGVHIHEEGKVLSIEDIFTENVMAFKARDIDLMKGPWRPGMREFGGQVLRGNNEPLGMFKLAELENTEAYFQTQKILDRMKKEALRNEQAIE